MDVRRADERYHGGDPDAGITSSTPVLRTALRPRQPPLRCGDRLQRGVARARRRLRRAPAQSHRDRHVGGGGGADRSRLGGPRVGGPPRRRPAPQLRGRRPPRGTQRRLGPPRLRPDVAGPAVTRRRTVLRSRPRHRQLHAVRRPRGRGDASCAEAGGGGADGGAGRRVRVRPCSAGRSAPGRRGVGPRRRGPRRRGQGPGSGGGSPRGAVAVRRSTPST